MKGEGILTGEEHSCPNQKYSIVREKQILLNVFNPVLSYRLERKPMTHKSVLYFIWKNFFSSSYLCLTNEGLINLKK